MKLCPTCQSKYPDDANFCPQEACATADGPRRLQPFVEVPKPRFQPGSRLGGGNTGEIWRARDNETGQDVAYKLIAAEVLPSPTAVARAEREFKQLMRVQNPRIASIVECGRTPDDRLFVASEIVEGEALDKLIKNGLLPLERAKAIVAQIGQALLEAQKAGIVHRDVAPKNVLVSSTGDVKVINFPLARPVNERVSGVPAYVSPEQAQGKPVDQRSNTYSLACILYHLLTGEPPFTAPTAQAVLDLHVSSPALPPSQRRPEANLSPDVDRVILKALDKNSSRRHLTLRLFLTEVEALVAPAPATSAPAPGSGRDVGFAKTMLFAGGQAEVANLVAKAIAARTAGNPAAPSVATTLAGGMAPMVMATTPASMPATGMSPTATAPRPAATQAASAAVQPTRVPSALHAPVAAAPASVASTMLAAPGAYQQTSDAAAGVAMAASQPAPAAARLTPPPVTPNSEGDISARAPVSATPGPVVGGAVKPAFRETLWFKKGDVDQMVADAKAKMATQGATQGKAPEVELGEEAMPIEDRYVDDGTVTAEDRKRFSLRTGGTQTAMPQVRSKAPARDRMSESQVMREIGDNRKTVVLIVAAVVVAAILVVAVMMMRGGSSAKRASTTPASAVAAPLPPPPAAATPAPAARPAAAVPAVAKRETAAATAARENAKKKIRKRAPPRKKR